MRTCLLPKGAAIKRNLGCLTVTALLVVGCSRESSLPTAPRTPFNRLLLRVTLSRLDPPPGGKHAVLATILAVARERPVAITGVEVYNYRNTAHIDIAGFIPQRLEPYKSTTFAVTLTSKHDVPCADEVILQVQFEDADGRATVGTWYDCTDSEWLF